MEIQKIYSSGDGERFYQVLMSEAELNSGLKKEGPLSGGYLWKFLKKRKNEQQMKANPGGINQKSMSETEYYRERFPEKIDLGNNLVLQKVDNSSFLDKIFKKIRERKKNQVMYEVRSGNDEISFFILELVFEPSAAGVVDLYFAVSPKTRNNRKYQRDCMRTLRGIMEYLKKNKYKKITTSIDTGDFPDVKDYKELGFGEISGDKDYVTLVADLRVPLPRLKSFPLKLGKE